MGMVMDMAPIQTSVTLCHLFCGPLPGQRWSIDRKTRFLMGSPACVYFVAALVSAASILFLWAPRKLPNQSGLIR